MLKLLYIIVITDPVLLKCRFYGVKQLRASLLVPCLEIQIKLITDLIAVVYNI